MALDAHYYADPAIHVKYERQTNPCFSCKNKAAQPGRKFCEKGLNMTKQKMGKKCASRVMA